MTGNIFKGKAEKSLSESFSVVVTLPGPRRKQKFFLGIFIHVLLGVADLLGVVLIGLLGALSVIWQLVSDAWSSICACPLNQT